MKGLTGTFEARLAVAVHQNDEPEGHVQERHEADQEPEFPGLASPQLPRPSEGVTF